MNGKNEERPASLEFTVARAGDLPGLQRNTN